MNDLPRQVLITGATGFIGNALVPVLLSRGDRVIVLSRNTDKALRQFGDRVEIIDNLDRMAGDRRVDAVVNLAGEPLAGRRWSAAGKKAFVDSRVKTTAALIGLMERLSVKPGVLISGSAVGYYGERGNDTLDEREGPKAEFLSEICQQWEAEALRAQNLGVRVVLLRTGLVFGKNGGLFPPLLLSSRFGLGAVLGTGEQWMPWIHIDDEVGLILHMLDHPTVSGPVNAVSPSPATQLVVMQTLASELHRPLWLRVPISVLRLAGEMSALFLISQRAVPALALATGYRFQYPELAPAISAIVDQT